MPAMFSCRGGFNLYQSAKKFRLLKRLFTFLSYYRNPIKVRNGSMGFSKTLIEKTN